MAAREVAGLLSNTDATGTYADIIMQHHEVS